MSEIKRKDAIQGDIIHEYDGIEEADNRLPNWWLATFYGSIVFAAAYFFYYHVYEMAPPTSEEYATELASRASEEAAAVDEPTLLAAAQDAAIVAQGREVFATNCVACHGEQAQGVIGPNLTDDRWIHGGSPLEIHATVRNGVQIEGRQMPAWGPVLGARPVQAVVAYVLSIRDTNVAGRAPEGEVYAPAAPEGAAPEGAAPEGAAPEGAAPEGAEGAAPSAGEGSPSAPAGPTSPTEAPAGAAPTEGAPTPATDPPSEAREG